MKLLQYIARWLAPPRCVGCRREGSLLCGQCQTSLPSSPRPKCFSCKKHNATGSTCLACRHIVSVTGLTVATTYDGCAQTLIRGLKYRRQREAAATLAKLLYPLLEPSNYDVICAVPVATTRLRARGYNQAELIARHVAHHLRLPYRQLIRRASNFQQVGHSGSDRLRQASQAFMPIRSAKGLRVLLVDDVLTTGATLNACAAALLTAGALAVWATAATQKEI